MKNLKQKLKKDAQAYLQQPSVNMHDSVMQSIEIEKVKHQQSKLSFSKWWLPAGFAVAVSSIIALNLSWQHNSNETPNSINSTQQLSQLSHFDMNELSITLEMNLIKDIDAEKVALQNDLEYMKNIFGLEFSI